MKNVNDKFNIIICNYRIAYKLITNYNDNNNFNELKNVLRKKVDELSNSPHLSINQYMHNYKFKQLVNKL